MQVFLSARAGRWWGIAEGNGGIGTGFEVNLVRLFKGVSFVQFVKTVCSLDPSFLRLKECGGMGKVRTR